MTGDQTPETPAMTGEDKKTWFEPELEVFPMADAEAPLLLVHLDTTTGHS